MSTILVEGSVIVGAGSCGECSAEPSVKFELGTCPNPKPSAYHYEGRIPVSSPSAFVTLPGVGASSPNVTRGDFLYLRTSVSSGMKVRITTLDPEGGADIVSIIPFTGGLLMEFPAAGAYKLVELKGSGTVDYVVSGMQ